MDRTWEKAGMALEANLVLGFWSGSMSSGSSNVLGMDSPAIGFSLQSQTDGPGWGFDFEFGFGLGIGIWEGNTESYVKRLFGSEVVSPSVVPKPVY